MEAEAKVGELQEALQTAQAQLAKVTGFSRAKVEEIHGLWQRVQEVARDQEEHEELRRQVAEQMEAMLVAEQRGGESEEAAKEAEEAARAQEDKLEQVGRGGPARFLILLVVVAGFTGGCRLGTDNQSGLSHVSCVSAMLSYWRMSSNFNKKQGSKRKSGRVCYQEPQLILPQSGSC